MQLLRFLRLPNDERRSRNGEDPMPKPAHHVNDLDKQYLSTIRDRSLTVKQKLYQNEVQIK